LRISDVNQWTILLFTTFTLLSGLFALAWRLFRKLNSLLELPSDVSKARDEITEVKEQLTALRSDVRNSNRESLLWRKRHLREEHGKT
jgi:hypothetical protein